MTEDKPPDNPQNWATPPEFMAAIEKRFGKPGFDLAASIENAKAEHFYTEQDDSLKQDWVTPKGLDPLVRYANPPFRNIKEWAEKCESVRFLPRLTLLLVPASVDSNWFDDHVHNKGHWFGLKGRIKFVGATNQYMKPIMLVLYGMGITGSSPWDWRSE